MTTEELIKYIEKKHLEYQMVSILMFNDFSFSFSPITNPRLYVNRENMTVELVGFDGVNLFSNEYRVPTFILPQEIAESSRLNRFLYHPEHLCAYILRQNNTVCVDILYSRRKDNAKVIRNAAFESFAVINSINTVEQFNHLYLRAEKIQKNSYRKGAATYEYSHFIEDSELVTSVQLANEDWRRVHMAFAIRLYSAFGEIFKNRFAISEYSVQFTGSTEAAFTVLAEFAPIKPIKTPLDRPITIINNEDDISNILYKLSCDIRPNILYIATGYMFESGLTCLLPAVHSIDNHADYHVELIVGDLYKYSKGYKLKSPNRATAALLNTLRNSHVVTNIYTCPDCFYHGKFYYISNGEISYVIMGSSNVTLSAFQRNREFNILYRFDRTRGQNSLELDFLAWYEVLKHDCVELFELDETMFPSNLSIDEEGTSYGSAIFKTITQEEEKQRFRFLESFSPSKIEVGIFKGKNYKPFKDYMLFVYPERGLSILEGFSYGKSCYIFSSTDIEKIKQELIRKSKDEVKKSRLYISDIAHDRCYMDTVEKYLKRIN